MRPIEAIRISLHFYWPLFNQSFPPSYQFRAHSLLITFLTYLQSTKYIVDKMKIDKNILLLLLLLLIPWWNWAQMSRNHAFDSLQGPVTAWSSLRYLDLQLDENRQAQLDQSEAIYLLKAEVVYGFPKKLEIWSNRSEKILGKTTYQRDQNGKLFRIYEYDQAVSIDSFRSFRYAVLSYADSRPSVEHEIDQNEQVRKTTQYSYGETPDGWESLHSIYLNRENEAYGQRYEERREGIVRYQWDSHRGDTVARQYLIASEGDSLLRYCRISASLDTSIITTITRRDDYGNPIYQARIEEDKEDQALGIPPSVSVETTTYTYGAMIEAYPPYLSPADILGHWEDEMDNIQLQLAGTAENLGTYQVMTFREETRTLTDESVAWVKWLQDHAEGRWFLNEMGTDLLLESAEGARLGLEIAMHGGQLVVRPSTPFDAYFISFGRRE